MTFQAVQRTAWWRAVFAIALAGAAVAGGSATAQSTFLGTSADWSNAANWSTAPVWTNTTTDIVFSATSSLISAANATNTNNVSSGTIRSLLFNASGYTLTGNPLFINGAGTTGTGAIANQSTSGTVTINLPLTFRNNQQTFITGTPGSTTVFGGNLTGGTNSAVSFRNLDATGTSTWVFNTASSLASSGTVEFLQNTNNVIVNSASAFGSAIIRVPNAVNFDNLSGTAVTLSNYQNNPAGGLTFRGSNPLGFGTVNATRSSAGDFTFTTNGTAGLTVSVITTDTTVPGSNTRVPDRILKSGTGTLVISGSSNYSIPTFINGGTLLLGNVSALGSGTLQFGTTVQLGVTTDLTAGVPNRLSIQWGSNARTLTFTGSNSVKFSGNFDGGNGANTDTSRGTFTFSNSGTSLVWFSGTTMTLAQPTSNISNWFYFNGSGNARIDNAILNASGSAAHSQSINKNESGILTLTNSNSYSGTTALAGGVLRLDNDFALPGGITSTSGSGILTISGSGVLGLGAGDFSRPLGTGGGAVQITTGGGFAAYGSGSTRNVNFGGGGTVTWGENSFMTTRTGTFILGHATADGTVDFQNPIATGTGGGTTRTISVAQGPAAVEGRLSGAISGTHSLVIVGGGMLSLTGTNSFDKALQVTSGGVEVGWLAAAGQNSPIGTSGTITLGGGATAGTFRWVGTTSATTSRSFYLGGTATGGDATIDASGQGLLRIDGTVTSADGAKTLTLSGTSTELNQISAIQGPGTGSLAVVKDGPGRWRLTGTSTFTGGFRLNSGTIVAAANAGNQTTSGVFGFNTPSVGGTAANLSGTVALLAEADRKMQSVTVTGTGVGSTQAVLIGGINTSGTATFNDNVNFQIGRPVSIVSNTGGVVSFGGYWLNEAGTGIPTHNVTIGAPGYAGTVRLTQSGTLATGGAIAVRFGTTLLTSVSTTLDGAGTLAIDSGATLGGIGTVASTLGGAGLVAPGNSPGILTAEAFDPTGGLGLAFEFTGATPTYTSGSASVNDVLRLTGTSPFLGQSLTAANVVRLYLPASGTAGGTFTGGFFTDMTSGSFGTFLASITNGGYEAYYLDNSGSFSYGGNQYSPLPSGLQVQVGTTTVSGPTNFETGGSVVGGQVSTFTVIVPEPGSMALAGIGAAVAAWMLRRRRPL